MLRFWRGGAGWLILCLAGAYLAAYAQVIEFENNGLKYLAITRQGLTIMYSRMPTRIREFDMIQVAVENGSHISVTIRPEDFTVITHDGRELVGAPARLVIDEVMEKGSHNDMVKLVVAYENALYAIPNMRVSNGYEERRRNAIGGGSMAKFRAAAAASAIALVQSRIVSGQSTDGAVFIPNESKSHWDHVKVKANGEVFDFVVEAKQ